MHPFNSGGRIRARHAPPLALLLACLTPLAAGHAAVLPSVNARTDDDAPARPASIPADADLVAAGARIGEVRIVIRDLFNTSRPDEDKALFRIANRLHIDTRDATVRDQLLFEPGQPYDPRVVEESARLLRTRRYLRDAWITPVAWRDGLVDLTVEVQDVWTFNPGVSFGRKGGKNTSGFELEELNLLGTGSQIAIGRKSGVDRDSTLLTYRDQQLGRSWWGVDAQFADNSDGRFAQLTLDHLFYSLDTRWAGGVSVGDDQRIDSRYDLGEVVDQYQVDQKLASAYVGWSRGLRNGWVTRWKIGYTRDERDFSALTVPAPTVALPADRTLAYPWLAVEWVEDDFRTERNRDQIARTEDIALGLRARVQVGFASESFGADRNATMLSGSVSHGWHPTPRQTLQLAASTSGRIEDGNVAGGLLGFDARWYFRQSERRVLYLGLSGLKGSNLDLDQQVELGGDNGLRGYPLRYQSGTSRWLFTAEQRLFSNWYPFRLFNVGGAVFFDMGKVSGTDPLGTSSQGLLRDIGFGLRLGNGRTGLGNVVHVDVAFPLDGDSSIRNVQFLVETKRSF